MCTKPGRGCRLRDLRRGTGLSLGIEMYQKLGKTAGRWEQVLHVYITSHHNSPRHGVQGVHWTFLPEQGKLVVDGTFPTPTLGKTLTGSTN